MPGIHQTENFLEKKRKSSLKFKAKNWDFGREEWNNCHCKSVLLCKSELLTDQWRKKKKSNQRIVLQRGRETWRKERRETARERERSMGRGETEVSDSEGVRREKVKRREKKWESLQWERDCFPKKIFRKQPIENKPYFF